MFLGVPISVYIYRQMVVPKDLSPEAPQLMLGEEAAPASGTPKEEKADDMDEKQSPEPIIRKGTPNLSLEDRDI
jgi:hypothetical protein